MTYDDTTTATLLDAGAVLPAGTTAREDADALTARTYTHPALDGRRIVRLVPGTLGEAEDLALDFLGLAREPEAPQVGQVRKETLGFPAWALVNDPANGHHALALVQDIERLARQAKSRPGTAKEGFEALGERLGRTVPHFLPTFYEQAARVFLQHENATYAAAFFGRARAAERVHALAVDEERQRAVFLEFAFAGALTVKALKEHVRDLTRRLDAATAWAQFRQLIVERCAAGMAPYASLPQDARGLIKAAGLDRTEEECGLVADLIGSPAAVRAPASFWTAYRAVLPVLAERRPEVRVRLLEFMPAALGRRTEDDEFWLAVLAETGADRLLTGEDGSVTAVEGGRAAVDAAEWLGRWSTHRKHGNSVGDRSPATLALVARMASRLRADGRPVDLFNGRWYAGADLDLLDLCASEGVPLAVPDAGKEVRIPLDRWLRDKGEGRRDLTATAADVRLRPLLHLALGHLGDQRTAAGLLDRIAAHPVLSDVLREWLGDAADAFVRASGLPGAQAALQRLRPYRPVAAQVNPEAVARVAAHPLAPLLGRTLRAGIPDELGWPALDEALRLLAPETRKNQDNSLTVADAWPALILARGRKAVVVGPDAVLLEHDLRVPVDLNRWQRPHFRWADGELLVIWHRDGKQHGYWSNRPTEVFTLGGEQVPQWYGGGTADPSVPLPDGGRATGGRTLHAGDTVLPPSRPVLGDGTGLWRQGRQGRSQVWLEYDPVTGTHGRASLPEFLRSAVRDDATLLQDQCEVLPLQPGLESSPFGTDGVVLGRWVRHEGQGADALRTAGTPDGRTVTLEAAPGRAPGLPLGALRLPGGAEPVAVRYHRQVALFAPGERASGGELGRVTLGERGGEFAAGTQLVPPLPFWHALRPRDEKASAVLRDLDDDRVGEVLLATAQALAERQALLVRDPSDKGGSGSGTAGPAGGSVAASSVAASAIAAAAIAAARSALAASGVAVATTGSATGATTGSSTGGPNGSGAGGTTGSGAGASASGQAAVPPADEVARHAVALALPTLTDDRLLTGVSALVRATLRLVESAAAFIAPVVERPRAERRRTEGMFADFSPKHGDDGTLRLATAGIAEQFGWWGDSTQWSAQRQIRAVNHVLSGLPADGKPLPAKTREATPGDGWSSDTHTIPDIGTVMWPTVLKALRPLVYRAATPTVPEEQREALLLLCEAIAEGPLAAPSGALREAVLTEPQSKLERAGQVLRRNGRTVVVLGCESIDTERGLVNWRALDHDPTGAFGAVDRFTLKRETRYTPAFPEGGLAAATRLIRDKGAAPARPEAPDALAAETGGGLGPAQSALLLAGRPQQPGHEESAALGLKPGQRDLAGRLLGALGQDHRVALVEALLPRDPADLWTVGPDIRAAGQVWAERLGGLVRLPEDVAADLPGVSAEAAEAVLNPARTPWLSRTTVQRLAKAGTGVGLLPEDPQAIPTASNLISAVDALAQLAYDLPHGHPLRAALPAGLTALRRRMADEGLLLELGMGWSEKGRPTSVELRTAYGLPESGGADADGLTRVGEALALSPWYHGAEAVLLRPAALTGPDDAVFGLLEGLVGTGRSAALRALRTVLADDLMQALTAGAEGDPGHAQDPARSVPSLVAEVARAHGLGEDAAALYLQLLALPDPTDRNCVRWTGWKPARMKKARAELAATGLVVEAKRARAGRTLFLPCGWYDLKAPALPLEIWKDGLYPIPPRGRVVPLLPVADLFARAWTRASTGDAPAYEELTTRATRKGRRR
ncbi:hypothetical protein [Streptomyces mangrovisoli]|uniref:hypothetical protein n=1 Tax=Streptomyces mangrovisoli TaxID=1428628 RepID=UPI0006219F38|nr:hypothetical protein [Streptomyces mangrovisoli]